MICTLRNFMAFVGFTISIPFIVVYMIYEFICKRFCR